MIKEIIFDCFGVLMEDGWLVFLHKYQLPENKDELDYINFQYDKGIISYDEFLESACRITGVKKAQAHSIIVSSLHPNNALLSYIQDLKKRGYALGVISNVGMSLDTILPPEFIECFDVMTLSYQVHAIKPHPEIFKRHLKRTGFLPDETVFIDDRAVNCEGARMVGMGAIHYQNVTQVRRELDSLLVK